MRCMPTPTPRRPMRGWKVATISARSCCGWIDKQAEKRFITSSEQNTAVNGGFMKLIGMLDSPYVRRVAISLELYGVAFEHQSLSVFSTFDEFSRINPVVKAPTLVLDDGTMLMDSGLILEYLEALAPAAKKLLP